MAAIEGLGRNYWLYPRGECLNFFFILTSLLAGRIQLADMCIRHNTFPWVDVRLTEAWPSLKSLPHQLKIHRSALRSLDGYLGDWGRF